MQSHRSTAAWSSVQPTREEIIKTYFKHLLPFLEEHRGMTIKEIFRSLQHRGHGAVWTKVPFPSAQSGTHDRVVGKIRTKSADYSAKYSFSSDYRALRVHYCDWEVESMLRFSNGPTPTMSLESGGNRYEEWTDQNGQTKFTLSQQKWVPFGDVGYAAQPYTKQTSTSAAGDASMAADPVDAQYPFDRSSTEDDFSDIDFPFPYAGAKSGTRAMLGQIGEADCEGADDDS